MLNGQTPERHKLVVKFDYDFDRNPACPPGYQPAPETKKKKKSKAKNEPPACVDFFNVYDISNGTDDKNKYFLFSIQLPDNPVGVKRVTGITPIPNFQPGRHKIAVGAHSPDFGDSNLNACWVILKITPEDLAPVGATGTAPAPASTQAGSSSEPGSAQQLASPATSQQGAPQTPRPPHPPHC